MCREIFSNEKICLLEQLMYTWNLQWWPSLSSWKAELYLESSVMTKSIFLKSWFVPGILSDDQVYLLEELIGTWNLQWWPSLSSWRADWYLEYSVMTKSVFLKSWFVPGIFTDDQVYLLEQLMCTRNVLYSDDQVCLLEYLMCTWNLLWWILSSCTANLYLDSSAMSRLVFLKIWFVPGIFSDDQVCLLNSWCVPRIFIDEKVCILEQLMNTWILHYWPNLSSWTVDVYLESSVMTKSVFLKSVYVPGMYWSVMAKSVFLKSWF